MRHARIRLLLFTELIDDAVNFTTMRMVSMNTEDATVT